EREADRLPVPAERLEMRAALAHRAVEVDAPDAPSGSAPDAAVQRDDQGGPVEALRQPRGHDADDALVPAVAGDDDRAPRPVADEAHRLADHRLLDGAALRVAALELRRERPRPVGVAGHEDVDRALRVGEAPAGVEARRDAEADRADGGALDDRRLLERLESRPRRPVERAEPVRHEDA